MTSVYVWDLIRPAGASGVATKEPDALQALAEALRAAPAGAEGIVRKAALPASTRSGYTYMDLIATGRRADDGTVVWTGATA